MIYGCKINIVSSGESFKPDICKAVPTHSSIDNNDGRQETLIGFGTTHHTNSLLFQPNVQTTAASNSDASLLVERNHPGTKEIPPYFIGKRKSPEPLPYLNMQETESTLLNTRFDLNLLWSIAGGIPIDIIPGEELPLIGSWTPFNKKTSVVKLSKSVLQYLPVVPTPPDYDVLKEYLDFLLDTTENLGIQHIFTHADEAVYSKLLHIIWKHGDYFQRIIPLMGGFHQLLVLQKVMYKRHGCIGYKKWFEDAHVIASGSVDKAIEGRHYYRCIRLHKEAFDAIVQMQIEKITDNYAAINSDVLNSLMELRRNHSSKQVEV